ncbi:MAG: hypothetical protein HY537_00755 [Deltaproteobacteria bacterium]|nr:hypothetical protein [Deltaproteobacteria bacterium]
MRGYAHTQYLILIAGIAFLQSAFCESPYINRMPVSASLIFVQRPNGYHDSDYLYREYFQPLDHQIQLNYLDQWRYHDMQMPFASMAWKHEHLSVGTMDYYRHAPAEETVRKTFASAVLRLRFDAAIRSYVTAPGRAPELRRVHQAIENMRNVTINTGGKGNGGEFRVGYDVFSDASKLEYSAGSLEAGLYYSEFLSSFSQLNRQMELMSMRLRAIVGGGLPTASFGYQLAGTALETGLSKPLSTSVEAQIVSVQPLRKEAAPPQSIECRLIYNF